MTIFLTVLPLLPTWPRLAPFSHLPRLLLRLHRYLQVLPSLAKVM